MSEKTPQEVPSPYSRIYLNGEVAPPSPDLDQHPDPFVRGVVGAVRELIACDQARRGIRPPSEG